jgi:cytochrome c biogenesis protein CcmG, thiol:disulfide interchange protein DsbE
VRRRLRVLGGTLALVAAIAVAAVLGLSSSPQSGRPAPALPRETLLGPRVTLTSLLAGAGGRPALVVFWASWCGPCAQEAPTLERFSRSAVGRGRIVGVDWSDPLTTSARAFIRRYAWSFPNLRDGEGVVGNDYRLTVLPTTFVIDTHGRIRNVLRGPQSEASLRSALAAVERS